MDIHATISDLRDRLAKLPASLRKDRLEQGLHHAEYYNFPTVRHNASINRLLEAYDRTITDMENNKPQHSYDAAMDEYQRKNSK